MSPSPGPTGARQPTRTRVVAVVVAAVVAAAAGFVVVVLASLVHRMAWRPTDAVTVPWGLILALLSAVALPVVARCFSRIAGALAAVGWIVGLVVVLGKGPGGDFLLAADWMGQAFLYGGAILVVVTAAWGGRGAGR